MKVYFGDGSYLEPDVEPRDTPFHKRIVKAKPILGTKGGHTLELECGHRAQSFGNLEHCDGVVLCTQCQGHARE